MIITFPPHSNKCDSVTVYDGDRYIEEHLISRGEFDNAIDVSGYVETLKEPRFEHAPADVRGNKEAPEYRAIARADGIWHAYDITAKNLGLPELPKATITDPHPVDGLESESQDDAQPKVIEAAESQEPASDKKSRTRR